MGMVRVSYERAWPAEIYKLGRGVVSAVRIRECREARWQKSARDDRRDYGE